jgi:Cys-tRNA(Pro)/Cys-tRNA(Cys) deacylase
MKISKTNAARLLDQARVAYELVAYQVDENDLSAIHAAGQLGAEAGQVFKTLVLRGDKSGPFVCLIPGNAEIDLKKAARVSGNKSCSLVALKELLPLTGYVRGGCSPLAMKKSFPTYIHASAEEWSSVYVSAGQRGLQIRLAPADLVGATGAALCRLAD